MDIRILKYRVANVAESVVKPLLFTGQQTGMFECIATDYAIAYDQ
jgi:hypothetical protein